MLLCTCCKLAMQQSACMICYACMIFFACMLCMHHIPCMHDFHAWSVVHAWSMVHAWCACMNCGACMMICMLCMHDLWACMTWFSCMMCMHDLLWNLNPMKSKSLLAIASHWGSPSTSSRHCGYIVVASRASQNCEHALWMWNGFITKMSTVWTMETKFSAYGNLWNCDCIFLVASRSTRNSYMSEKCSKNRSATWSTTLEREEK